MTEPNSIPPSLLLRQLSFVMRASRALYAAVELDIADILARGPQTSAEIAAKTGTHTSALRRLLRALVAHGVFEEPVEDLFRLNAAGDLLRKDVPGSQRAGVLFTAGPLRWQLWSDFLDCVRTGQAVVERAFGMNIFQRLSENAEESALFNQAMTSYSAALSAPVLAVYDFSCFTRITDVGGGNGRFLTDILAANPKSHGVLFDLPGVMAAATALVNASEAAGRCEIFPGNFFEMVPAGADCYLIKQVIHDWDDTRCLMILRNCRQAMGPNATLLIVERVMPERAEQGRAADFYLLDLEMLVNTPGGRERTEEEFEHLLTAASFRLNRIVSTTSPVSLIEALPV
jgi:hypothetical protein